MSKKYEKLTIKVSAQTAYHLDQISRAEQCSIGRVVDKLVRDRMLSARPQAIHTIRYYDEDGNPHAVKYDENGVVLDKGGVRD